MGERHLAVRLGIHRALRHCNNQFEKDACLEVLNSEILLEKLESALETEHTRRAGTLSSSDTPITDFILWVIELAIRHPREFLAILLLIVTFI